MAEADSSSLHGRLADVLTTGTMEPSPIHDEENGSGLTDAESCDSSDDEDINAL